MPQPHAVIALPNNIEIDARAQRNGLALLAAGYRVTLIGWGTGIPHEGVIAGMPYKLCQAPAKAAAQPTRTQPTILYRIVRKAFHLTLRRRPPQKVAKAIAHVDDAIDKARKGVKDKVLRPALALAHNVKERIKPTPEAEFTWQAALPHVPVMIDSMLETVVAADPDVIVTDVHLLPLGAAVAERQAAQGKRMGLVYDAREYVYGLASDDPNITRGFPALEAQWMDKVDATVTVCEPIADFLARQYHLDVVPPLVPNAPIGGLPPIGEGAYPMTIRDFLRIGDAPLLVYAGGLNYQRGVHDVVVALAELPGVHLAIGARRGSSYTDELEEIAERHGVRDRMHFVPFAPTHEVADYLASGTAAIIPFLPVGNHVWAAPNKYFESVQARLPIITSDMEWLQGRVTELGIGEVFKHSNPASCAEAVRKVLGNLDHYKAQLTDEVVAAHTFEHYMGTVQDVVKGVTDPALLDGLLPSSLDAHLVAIRRDMMRQRANLADADLFERRPWLRIGCTNTGGQPQLWASSLMRDYPEVIAESVWLERDQYLCFAVDQTITRHDWVAPAWQRALQHKLEDRVTHVLTESGRPVLGTKSGDFFYHESDYLRSIGVRQGLVFHGSDIRNPRIHASLEPDSPLADPADELTAVLQRQVEALTPHVLSFDGPVFVTTNDLLDYLPMAIWLPVVVDTQRWSSDAVPLAHAGPPVVFHVPSRRSFKGSDAVDDACRALADEGRIAYLGATELTREQMLHQMLSADIVIDQVRLGDYGITAVEAMSAGKVVVGHVADRVRSRIDGDVPIVEATGATLRAVLEGLIDDRDRGAELSRRGREYVARWHDGRHSARVLADFIGVAK